ncbi:hypothetical protein ElyMa_001082200 [Elysia marginata]|uniref:Uncharacterized protein n=1 Tax=Elysia marginata TaxID=1093978 RepID=A0AAV4HT67_9GAST|nr:hypothetical protein ElyMa_001082200 [Elysia marginata]
MEVLPDPYIFYPLPPWRAQRKGDTLLLLKPVGMMDTHQDPHLRRIPDQCPYPHCLNPPGQEPSGEAEKGGGTAGKGMAVGKEGGLPARGRARRRRSACPTAGPAEISRYTPYGVNTI